MSRLSQNQSQRQRAGVPAPHKQTPHKLMRHNLPTRSQLCSSRISAMPPIVLGKDMADNLGATVGSVVLVVSPQGELTPFGTVPKYNRFHVVGIFNSGFFDYDANWAFVRLSDAQKLFGLGDLISVIEFKVDDIYQAAPISRELEDAAGKGFMATNWEEQNKALFHALSQEKLRHADHRRPHRICGGAEHPDLSHHDGHGKDERYLRSDVHGRSPGANAESLHCAGRVDWRHWYRHRSRARLCHLLMREGTTMSFRCRLRSTRSTTSPSRHEPSTGCGWRCSRS